jgi:hypothetical protein
VAPGERSLKFERAFPIRTGRSTYQWHPAANPWYPAPGFRGARRMDLMDFVDVMDFAGVVVLVDSKRIKYFFDLCLQIRDCGR